MLAGQIVEPGKVALVEQPEPEIGDAEIIFQPELACLCGSDIPFFTGARAPCPLAPGLSLHEMIGTVVATSGRRWRPGDRVLAVPEGQQGFRRRYAVSERRAVRLEPRLSPPQAVLAQPLGTVLFGLKKIPDLLGRDVAVVGQGPIGLLFCAALRHLGAREIIAVDRLEERLAVSPRMGATRTVDAARRDPVAAIAEVTSGHMVDVVIEAVGHAEQALNLCIDLVAERGRILYFGVPPERLDGIEWSRLFFKNASIHTTVNPDFDVDFPLAMRWIVEGRVEVTPLATHRLPLSECQRAFELYRDRRDGALKVFLEFPAGTGG